VVQSLRRLNEAGVLSVVGLLARVVSIRASGAAVIEQLATRKQIAQVVHVSEKLVLRFTVPYASTEVQTAIG
jgi:hypothetical protein